MGRQPKRHEEVSDSLRHAFAGRARPEHHELITTDVSVFEAHELSELLRARATGQMSREEIRDVVGTNLYLFSPKAFHYYLPELLSAVLTEYAFLTIFANEVVDALIRPPTGRENTPLHVLQAQDRQWDDADSPDALFAHRFETLSHAEGTAVLAFIEAFRDAHGQDFPFGELDLAIERHWHRYQAEAAL